MNNWKTKIGAFILPVGLLIFLAAKAYACFFSLPDFTKGFFEGMGGTLIVIGIVFWVFLLVKKYRK